MFNFKVAQLKAETKEYEVELEEKLTGEHHCGSYRVTEMKDEGRKQNFSTFQSTLGFNEEDWEAFIRISSILKVPFSERDFEASISRNEKGEETATIVWNDSVAEAALPSGIASDGCGVISPGTAGAHLEQERAELAATNDVERTSLSSGIEPLATLAVVEKTGFVPESDQVSPVAPELSALQGDGSGFSTTGGWNGMIPTVEQRYFPSIFIIKK